jgi:hypothetical protein
MEALIRFLNPLLSLAEGRKNQSAIHFKENSIWLWQLLERFLVEENDVAQLALISTFSSLFSKIL